MTKAQADAVGTIEVTLRAGAFKSAGETIREGCFEPVTISEATKKGLLSSTVTYTAGKNGVDNSGGNARRVYGAAKGYTFKPNAAIPECVITFTVRPKFMCTDLSTALTTYSWLKKLFPALFQM